jgi:hypothetical protein
VIGITIEKRQLSSYEALLRALGFFVPIAWRLLTLRHVATQPEPRPATCLFDAEQFRLFVPS